MTPCPREVLRQFRGHFAEISQVRAVKGGLSGAEIWRVDAGRSFCLRAWPAEHPTPERLAWMHGVLKQAVEKGLDYIPAPLPAAAGASFFPYAARRWELTPWLPGEADFRERPSERRLENALRALARFHQATVDFSQRTTEPRLIPGWLERRDRMHALLSGGYTTIAAAVNAAPLSPLTAIARELLGEFSRLASSVEQELAEHRDVRLTLQPCIRDLHAKHVLFVGDDVTGIVDYGALRPDSVVGDLVRLLDSLLVGDDANWSPALAAYAALRPLSEPERALIPAWRHSSLLISALNWLDWIFVEGRQFDDVSVVTCRLVELREALQRLRSGSGTL